MTGDLATLVEGLAEADHQASLLGIYVETARDADAAEASMWRLLARALEATGERRDAIRDLANEYGIIGEGLRADPERPSDDELCRRYASHELSGNTVRVLTGWDRYRIWSECLERGIDPFGEEQ